MTPQDGCLKLSLESCGRLLDIVDSGDEIGHKATKTKPKERPKSLLGSFGVLSNCIIRPIRTIQLASRNM